MFSQTQLPSQFLSEIPGDLFKKNQIQNLEKFFGGKKVLEFEKKIISKRLDNKNIQVAHKDLKINALIQLNIQILVKLFLLKESSIRKL